MMFMLRGELTTFGLAEVTALMFEETSWAILPSSDRTAALRVACCPLYVLRLHA